jgi:hypothetical protein
VPADHRDTQRSRSSQRQRLRCRIEAAEDDAGGLKPQGGVQGAGLPRRGPLAVEDLKLPADGIGCLLDPEGRAGDAAVGQIAGDEDH